MRILGIDPGLAIVGWGVIEYQGSKFKTLGYGAIRTPAGMPTHERLVSIDDQLKEIIDKFKPEHLAVEELFWNTNQKTGICVAEARGTIIVAAHKRGLKIAEYTPLQVKQSVVGYGRAEKKQVQEMTRIMLNLEKIPMISISFHQIFYCPPLQDWHPPQLRRCSFRSFPLIVLRFYHP